MSKDLWVFVYLFTLIYPIVFCRNFEVCKLFNFNDQVAIGMNQWKKFKLLKKIKIKYSQPIYFRPT
jgi:hypothetical protein